MTATMIFGILVVLMCGFYAWANLRCVPKNEKVYEVEAGSTASSSPLGSYEAKSKIIKLHNGRYITTADFIRIKIHGECMSFRNIKDGDEWLVERLEQEKIKPTIQVRDVLLIYIKEKNVYKIREFVGYAEDGTLKTRYYEGDSERASSRNHTVDQVLGVVRYLI